nr:mechanosensitive ion channel [Moraxella sp. CTOTU48841]
MDNFFINFNQTLGSSMMTMISALIIFILGWIIAGIIGSVVHKLLEKLSINQKMNASTGKTYDLAHLLSRIAFWFVFIIGISAALSYLHLDAISVPFANMVNSVLLFIPNLIAAGLLALLGWVLATVARSALSNVLSRTSVDEKLSSEAGVPHMSDSIANLVYWFILLMFLPMVLQQLGVTGLLAPINGMISKALSYIPNLIGAGVIIFVGFVIAKILRGIVTNIVTSLNIQSLAGKAGISNQTQIANIAGTLVYLVVMITAIIMGLNVLNIQAISGPATNMLNEIMLAIPNIIYAVVILGGAYFVSKLIADIVKNLLDNSGVNILPSKLGLQNVLGSAKVSDVVGYLIVFFVMLFAVMEAAKVLNLTQVSNLITVFIAFGSQVILGAVILAVGFWLANILASAVQRSPNGTAFLANLVRVLIMGLVLAMGLRAMGIADSIVNMAFGLTLGAVAVAFALAFGLGGREAAARFLKNIQDKAEGQTSGLANMMNQPVKEPTKLTGFETDVATQYAPTQTGSVERPIGSGMASGIDNKTATVDTTTSLHTALNNLAESVDTADTTQTQQVTIQPTSTFSSDDLNPKS